MHYHQKLIVLIWHIQEVQPLVTYKYLIQPIWLVEIFTQDLKCFFSLFIQEQGATISAHNGPLVAMSFDMSGTRIATASNKVCRRN